MRKRIINYLIVFVAIIAAFPYTVHSQTVISSPYSRFGIGNVNVFNNSINNAMGGVSYALQRNNSINYMNPASYAGIDTVSFVFDIGFYSEWVSLKNNQYKSKGNNTNLSHILIGLPISSKLKLGMGIMPMSSVNFTTSQDFVDSEAGKYREEYAADGGLNKVALGFAYEPINNLSFGVNFEYIFGNYYKSSTISFPDSLYMFSSRIENNYHIKAFNLNLGVQYFHPLKNGDKLGVGLVYDYLSKFPTDNILSSYTFTSAAGLEYLKDSIKESKTKNTMTYPATLGIGLSYERPNNFFIGIDGRYETWSDFLFQKEYPNNNFHNSFRLSFGGEWKPDAYGGFFKKSIYRFGFFYDDGLLEINNTRISQLGVSCGFGFPIKKSNTMINLSLEYVKRGTTKHDLIQEDYFRLGLSFSAKDLWFFKRKYQ